MVRLMTMAVLAIALMMACAGTSLADDDGYQQYYRYLSKVPDKVQGTDFHSEANGLAHDENYWYITNNDYDDLEALWKIPVGISLYGIDKDTPGVSVVKTDEMVCPTTSGPLNLRSHLGYDHLGDLVAYEYEGQYYLLIPIENGAPGDAMAILRADDPQQCVGFDVLRVSATDPSELNDASAWLAVDREGYVYTSPNDWARSDGVVKLLKYRLNWADLGSAPARLTYLDSIPLLDEDGWPLPQSEIAGHSQGGEFSPDGELLYLVSGGTQMSEDEEMHAGIQVFETRTWKRVARSHNSEDTFFKYDFNSGWSEYDEPEGLTIWDLDEGRGSYQEPGKSPHIQGQLHVLLLQNYVWTDPLSGHAVYIYHYTNAIHVDGSFSGSADGTIGRPYSTVGEALGYYDSKEDFNYGHWTGGRIKIHAGSYPETLTFSRRVQLVPWGGQAVVGSRGRLALADGGAVNVEHGALRIY